MTGPRDALGPFSPALCGSYLLAVGPRTPVHRKRDGDTRDIEAQETSRSSNVRSFSLCVRDEVWSGESCQKSSRPSDVNTYLLSTDRYAPNDSDERNAGPENVPVPTRGRGCPFGQYSTAPGERCRRAKVDAVRNNERRLVPTFSQCFPITALLPRSGDDAP